MTLSEIVLLGLVVAAAVVAGYFIGRWSADRELGQRSARPNPLPAPDGLPEAIDDEPSAEAPTPHAPGRSRGTPPPASAGGDYDDASPPPRPRSGTPPPASASDAGASKAEPAAARPKRGPPPPAAAGVMGTGEPTKRER